MIQCKKLRNGVKRLFKYPKEKTVVSHHELSIKNHIQGIENLNILTLYYQTIKMGRGE